MEAGHGRTAKGIAKLGAMFTFLGMPFCMFCVGLVLYYFEGAGWEETASSLKLLSIISLIIYSILFPLLYLSFRGDALKGTQIIDLLGFEDAKNVDLRKINKQTKAAWVKKHPGQHFPFSEDWACIHY